MSAARATSVGVSGRAAIADRLAKIGFDLDKDQVGEVFLAFKELADKKKVIYDGDLIARKIDVYCDAGAYVRHTPYGGKKVLGALSGSYYIPNCEFNSYHVCTNKQPSSSMRGFGVTGPSFGNEVHMTRIAEEIGMDPWEFRMKNAKRRSQNWPHGAPAEDDPSNSDDATDGATPGDVAPDGVEDGGVEVAHHLVGVAVGRRVLERAREFGAPIVSTDGELVVLTAFRHPKDRQTTRVIPPIPIRNYLTSVREVAR